MDMAYRILWTKFVLLQYILWDFVDKVTETVIDCRTEEGQIKFIELFGYAKFRRLARYYRTEFLVYKNYSTISVYKNVITTLFQNLNERSRRLVAAFMFLAVSKQKIKDFAISLDIDPKTIRKGIKELVSLSILPKNRIRKIGGGRKLKSVEYPEFLAILENITEDQLAGDPMTSKKWVRNSLKYYKAKLKEIGVNTSMPTIRKNFKKLKISLKSNKKALSTKEDKRRNSQFDQLNRYKNFFISLNRPVISIDTKKKEPIGIFKNFGRLWKKVYTLVHDHDFANLWKAKAIPFGIYDIAKNKGYVYINTSHETSEFLVASLVRWWEEKGKFLYPNAKDLLILCDAGGSNGYRRKGWKYELYKQFSVRFGIEVTVCHYPPGASKWNPIEHRLFSFISINWAGEPLESIEKMFDLINSTATETGLTVEVFLDEQEYKTGMKYTKEQMDEIKIKSFILNPKLNYTICPH
jgi:hypothetical protein